MAPRKVWLEREVERLRAEEVISATEAASLEVYGPLWPKSNPNTLKKHGDPLRKVIA